MAKPEGTGMFEQPIRPISLRSIVPDAQDRNLLVMCFYVLHVSLFRCSALLFFCRSIKCCLHRVLPSHQVSQTIATKRSFASGSMLITSTSSMKVIVLVCQIIERELFHVKISLRSVILPSHSAVESGQLGKPLQSMHPSADTSIQTTC